MRFETKPASKLVMIVAASAALLSAAAGCGAMDNSDSAMANTDRDAVAASPSTNSSAPSSSSSARSSTTTSEPRDATTQPTSGAGAAAQDASCKAANLSAALGDQHGAAGTTYQTIVFTNTGQNSCTLKGFPGASYVTGPSGKQVGQAAQRTGAAGSLVTLAAGKTAKTDVGFTRVGFYDASECQPTPVRGLRIYAPGDRAAMFVAMQDQQGCAGTVPGSQLKVTSVRQ